MTGIAKLLEKNHQWAEEMARENPDFFPQLVKGQTPKSVWIGCSDSRVPASEIVASPPGDLFVHRNVANVASPQNLGGMAVLEYALKVLGLRDVIVCGHYGCGGIQAVLDGTNLPTVNRWLRDVDDVRRKHEGWITSVQDKDTQWELLCELNVIEQVMNLTRTPVVLEEWKHGNPITLHGWIFSLTDGKIRDLCLNLNHPRNIAPHYEKALEEIQKRYLL